MIVKLLTEHHLGFLSLIGGCRGSLESTLVKMSNCWKSHFFLQDEDFCMEKLDQEVALGRMAGPSTLNLI